MEFLLESHSTVEKSYRLVYSARNKLGERLTEAEQKQLAGSCSQAIVNALLLKIMICNSSEGQKITSVKLLRITQP